MFESALLIFSLQTPAAFPTPEGLKSCFLGFGRSGADAVIAQDVCNGPRGTLSRRTLTLYCVGAYGRQVVRFNTRFIKECPPMTAHNQDS